MIQDFWPKFHGNWFWLWPVFIVAWLLPVFADSMLRWSTWPCFMGFVICHISGFPINQSLDSIHGQSRESNQPLDTSSIVPGSVTIIFHNTINMYICLYKWYIICIFFIFSTSFLKPLFTHEIVIALWRRRYFDIFVDR